jgi:hypothetical protein
MTQRLDAWGWIFLVSGVGALANATWMLVGPMHWYTDLPAAVPDTGPFNPHFVRDIGCAFLTVGAALVWAAFNAALRRPLVSVSALFLGAHALLHIYDTALGNLPHSHWWLDLPGVYLPALLLAAAAWSYRAQGAQGEANAHGAHRTSA